MNNILSLTFILGALQGILLSVVLFTSKVNKTTNKILSAAVFTVSIALLLAYFQLVLNYEIYTFQIKSILPLSLIFVPLLYLYTKRNTQGNKKISLRDTKYFLPFLVILIYNIPFYFGNSQNKIDYFVRENITNSSFLIDKVEIVLVNFIIFSFSSLILLMVLGMKKKIEKEVSNYASQIIKLMFFFAFTILTFTSIGLILSILSLFEISYPDIFNYLTAIGSTLLIYFLGYYTLLHPHIFVFSQKKVKTEKVQLSKKFLAEKKDDAYEDYLLKILKSMEKDKLYQNPELTLKELAETLKIPSYLVSKIINTKVGLNFYNFVNKYRIEEVKQKLSETKSPPIMQIAFEAGFNTKSSFYNYFKKDTGISPKDFIKKNIKNKSI